MIETRFDEANLKQFLLYDYNALASYNKVEEKTKVSRTNSCEFIKQSNIC